MAQALYGELLGEDASVLHGRTDIGLVRPHPVERRFIERLHKAVDVEEQIIALRRSDERTGVSDVEIVQRFELVVANARRDSKRRENPINDRGVEVPVV